MSDEDRTEESDRDGREAGHTGHDKYRPVNLQSDRSDPRRKRGAGRGNDRGSGWDDTASRESGGRDATGTRRYGSAGTERGARGRTGERRAGDRRGGGVGSGGRVGGNDAHRAASERHRSARGGRPSDRRSYDSRYRQHAQSGGNPPAGSQRGSHREDDLAGRLGGHRGSEPSGPGDDQASLGDRYRYGGERGGSRRDRRYGSRRGNSAREDPRRE